MPHGHTLEEWQPKAVKNVLTVVGIYAIFLALSSAHPLPGAGPSPAHSVRPVLCFLGNAAKRKMRPAVRARRS